MSAEVDPRELVGKMSCGWCRFLGKAN